MTPKEKAEVLVHDMHSKLYSDGRYDAIQCAIIAVEEIIEIMRGYDTDYACDCGYYQKVLTELKSMQ